MIVKICGITRPDDAQCAVEHGATALGFVCWPESPRFIEPSRVRAIVARLPPFVTAVGVFVNQSSAHVNRVAAEARLSAVQLHGDETPRDLDAIEWPVIKAITLAQTSDGLLGRWPHHTTLLLDAHDPVRRGGTGAAVDWTEAATVAAKRPIVLAGGLNPDNVIEAVTRVRPAGVDVSSGVEVAPGLKDQRKVRAFLEAIKEFARLQGTPWPQ